MKKGMIMAMTGLALVVAAAYLVAGDSFAQSATKSMNKARMTPPVKTPIKLCNKPDLAQWKANLPLGPKGEFPFEGPCKNCYKKLGAMNLPTMSVWIINKGMANAPASKARLKWKSAKPPYTEQSIVANVPALKAGAKYLLQVAVPVGKFFQTARPITLQLDSSKVINECSENNNTMTYRYR